MIGDAVPVRFSRRIKSKASLLPFRVSPKRKIRKSAVNKRTSGVNFSLLETRDKSKIGEENNLHESLKLSSKIFTRTSSNLKPVAQKSHRISIPKICDKRRKIKNSLKTSIQNKVSLKKLELFNNSKTIIKKRNRRRVENEEKRFIFRSLKRSTSSLSKEKGKNKELSVSDLKPPGKTRLSQKKSTKQVTTLSSESVLIPNPGKSILTPKSLERRKSARLSREPENQDKSVQLHTSKSFAATPVPGKVIHVSKLLRNRKSESVLASNPEKSTHTPKVLERKKSAKNQDKSVQLPTSKSFAATPIPGKVICVSKLSRNRKSESVLTPNPEKSTHTPKVSERKKSARRATEPQNQEISVHMRASKSFAVTPVPGKVTRISKLSGNKKSGRGSKQQNRSRIMNSEISERGLKSFQSPFETPLPEKHSEKRKSSRLLESSPLKTLNKELPFCTPASLLKRNPDSTQNKSSKSRKSVELLSASRSRKQRRPKLSNEDSLTVSHEKRKQKRPSNRHPKTSGNFKKLSLNETENLLVDVLSTPVFKPPIERSLSKKYLSKSDSKSSKRKLNASASENQVTSEEMLDAKKRKSADFPKIPAKGTLKHKRWLLNNLKEKNGSSYEDDIFENHSFDLYKSAFHFGDESDGSSVNIATPKFDCILTPALPKKTPRFKDCISPTEFLQARKTAEEYLFRRNKKRKSGDRQSSSGKKASVNKKNTAQDIPEKKKLDFDEAMNNLIAVQKNLEIEAEVDDEEKDSYFSDASN